MMKLFSKGPSREGSGSLRLGAKVRACVLWVTLLLGMYAVFSGHGLERQ